MTDRDARFLLIAAGPETVFQWLIERGQPERHEPTVWLENSAAHPASHQRWTTDAYQAAMFPTKATAEEYITEQRLTARAVEHGFMTRLDELDTEGVLWVAAIDRVPIAERIAWVKEMLARVEQINAMRRGETE